MDIVNSIHKARCGYCVPLSSYLYNGDGYVKPKTTCLYRLTGNSLMQLGEIGVGLSYPLSADWINITLDGGSIFVKESSIYVVLNLKEWSKFKYHRRRYNLDISTLYFADENKDKEEETKSKSATEIIRPSVIMPARDTLLAQIMQDNEANYPKAVPHVKKELKAFVQ